MAERWYEGKVRSRSVSGKRKPVGENELAGEILIQDAYSKKSMKKKEKRK